MSSKPDREQLELEVYLQHPSGEEDLGIDGLIFQRVGHAHRCSVKHVNAPSFPKPLKVGLGVQGAPDQADRRRKECSGRHFRAWQ